MTKPDSNVFGKEAYVKAVREKLGVTIADATAIYEVDAEITKDALDAGLVVRLPGIGSISKVVLPAGPARNPSNGNTIQVGEGSKYRLKSRITREPVAAAN